MGDIDLMAVSIAAASATFNESHDTDHDLLMVVGIAAYPTISL
jgi:hypothetical protein